ncbi:hypothetical protein J6590_088701 [Homalodisca vitripennis]|nr:hypothetical protein J6590_088701 [Homalodisca vitripennis]
MTEANIGEKITELASCWVLLGGDTFKSCAWFGSTVLQSQLMSVVEGVKRLQDYQHKGLFHYDTEMNLCVPPGKGVT